MRKKGLVVIAMLLAATMTSCGKNNETVYEEFETISTEDGQSKLIDEAKSSTNEEDDLAAFDETESTTEEESNEELFEKELVLSNGKNITIKANVEDMGCNDAFIYQLEKIEVNEDYLIELAKKIFDNGEYTTRVPYRYMSEAGLEAEKKKYDEMLKDKGENYDVWAFSCEYNMTKTNGFDKTEPVPVSDKNVLYMGMVPVPLSPNSPDGRYAIMQGEIDHRLYELCYCEEVLEDDCVMPYMTLKPLFPTSSHAYIDNPEGGKYYYDDEKLRDETQEKAEEIMKQFGLEDYYVTRYEGHPAYESEDNRFYMDGYDFIFSRKMQGVAESQLEELPVKQTKGSDNSVSVYSDQEYVKVGIDKDGVLNNMEISLPYKLGEAMSEQPKLLSMEEAVSVMNDYLDTLPEDAQLWNDWRTDRINHIRFAYLPVQYGGEYAYMPSWIFMYKDGQMDADELEESYEPLVAVSAVDGEVMYFEYYPIPER